MLGLVKGVYSEDLLSSRLEGRAIKEALAISLLLQFREENPSPTAYPPHWIPRELLSKGQEVLKVRLSFLAGISKKPTARERRLKVSIEKHPSVTGGKSKCKLTMTPSEKLAVGPPPCKRQKVFTNTPQELVKIFAAYMQAQATLLEKPLLHLIYNQILLELLKV